ncbi:MAG: phosphoribosyltransferase family protein [Rikenellaceae bacterium]
MSILSSILTPIWRVLFQPRCGVCRERLAEGQHFVCTQCRFDMAMTGFQSREFNPMAQRAQSIRPQIAHASALIYYDDGGWRAMIHRMKYKGEWISAWLMGRWLGEELARSPLYADIDLVIGVPLHPRRQLSRGYNQSHYIALGVARSMGISCSSRGIRRVRYNTSQVRVERSERWRNVESLFEITNPKIFEHRRVLIVDDVYTTGATMLSCAEAILDGVPTATVSIATVAISRHEYGIDEYRQR